MSALSTAPAPSPAPIAADLTLSPEQVAGFQRDGFLRLERIAPDHEVALIRATLARLFSERRGRETGDQFDLGGSDEEGKPAGLPQILGPSRFAPELKATHYHANGLAVARQLLGTTPALAEQVRWGGDHTILKPAHHGLATPWHQDEAYWDPWTDHNGISIWLALQDATIANGTMWFVPGSHRFEILEHRPISDDPRIHGLELVDASIGARGLAQPVPAGGCLIHHCRTLHHAGPNTTSSDRHAYIIGFSSPGTRRPVRRHVPWQDRQRTPRSARAAAAQAAAAAAAAAAARSATVAG